jgi:SAM-dependent methyltransferase
VQSRGKLKSIPADLAKRVCDGMGIPRYFVHEVAFETRMMGIRLYGLAPFRRRKIRKLEKSPELRLIFGCGKIHYPGWIGIDCFRHPAVDLLLDLRRRLPFGDCSVDYCYSEHFVEHLYPAEAQFHLQEVHRILKPEGIYRMVVPAGILFARKYLEGDAAFFTLAHPWEPRPLDALYKIVNWKGQHRRIYDLTR